MFLFIDKQKCLLFESPKKEKLNAVEEKWHRVNHKIYEIERERFSAWLVPHKNLLHFGKRYFLFACYQHSFAEFISMPIE